MSDTMCDEKIKVEMWERADTEGTDTLVDIERTAPNEIALFTFQDDRGSITSIYFSREAAIAAAGKLLTAAALR